MVVGIARIAPGPFYSISSRTGGPLFTGTAYRLEDLSANPAAALALRT